MPPKPETPQLVSDLVETSINNTAHNTDNEGEHVVSARVWGIEATKTAASKTPEPFINNKPTRVDGAAYTAAGATTFLSAAALPGHPSPPLLTPTPSGTAPHIALQHWNTGTLEHQKLPKTATTGHTHQNLVTRSRHVVGRLRAKHPNPDSTGMATPATATPLNTHKQHVVHSKREHQNTGNPKQAPMTNQPGHPGGQPFDLSTWLRDHPATQNLPTEAFATLVQTMVEEFELWVGMELILGLTDAQMDELDTIADIDDARLDWLATNIPNHTQTTQNLISGFLAQTTDVLTRLKNTEADPATWGLELTLHISEHFGMQENQARTLNKLGHLHQTAGRWDQAHESYTQALDLYTQLNRSKDQALVHTNLGLLHKDVEQWDQTESEFNQALALYTQLDLTEDQAVIHTGLGNLHHVASRWSKALSAYSRALAYFSQLGLLKDQAIILAGIGRLNQDSGHWNQALTSYTHALNLYIKLGLLEDQARTYISLGRNHYDAGRWNQALSKFLQAHSLYTQLGLLKGQATAQHNLGRSHEKAGHWEQALDSYNRALQIYTQLRLIEDQADVLNSFGSLYKAAGHWEQALDSYTQALKIYTQLKIPKGQAAVHINLGTLHHICGRLNQALDSSFQSLEIYTQLKLPISQVQVHNNLGAILQDAGRWDQALVELTHALQLITNLGLSQTF